MGVFNPNKIRELRKKNKISQKKLGEYLGISDRAVSKWELGLSSPSGQNLIQLSKVFKVPVECFLYENDEIKVEKQKRGMESLTELYKIGRGPSSSHTIGPERACVIFKEKNTAFRRYQPYEDASNKKCLYEIS